MDETHVVTCFLRNRGAVLLLRRSEDVGSYSGQWGGVAGHAEGDPDALAREEIEEETGLLSSCTFVRAGDTFDVADDSLDKRWVVHPYLFDCASRDATTDWETTETAWVPPTEILRRETVPDLWTSYDRVAPTVESVAEDAEHGSAYISVRALEVLRDRAGLCAVRGGDWDELTRLAADLIDARPSMAALANRVNRVMSDATDDRTPEAVERAAIDGIERAYRVDEAATRNAREQVADETVLTLSRSGTVLDALRAADRVFVAESRPALEGVGVAESLADATNVTLHTDAAIAHVLATEDVDRVVVGADSVLPNGDVVNKTGTRVAALAARNEDVPVFVVTATDKVRTGDDLVLEEGNPDAVYDGDADLSVLNPTFDVTPAEFVSGYVTERGLLEREGIEAVADELRELAEWND
ncbi:initiation factor 2B related protein [Haladaptatus paucihalophilus DX253]|uniref:Initiation factor 2B related protein n=1 Tax=Haladaptatus paucihalophilus DX253 TaxID=797209 RepID=E7QTU9_HALPU|nr:NUDIX domain-containing protein [Haladaptatus paucihalophilus]EFW92028.1 initiation factor 2B related protein [Haladaptatus paucihalophilus DX253]SHK86193.1 Translation initiation factor 2B subunit, eIF-2B alpha/beta/delta family [Haladaptatus paucihalophilus DX253]